ncbi:hypothetical protein EYF80_001857 [Liparis tanakae]|uniref:Uncharacterized protein n=1 Tax=Liparis tanakae TaxID=230148 RepID=A0A4Z2JDQ5_9TELE|nr:hypothetical protein EYF80_001857 [Liparis tanakae]
MLSLSCSGLASIRLSLCSCRFFASSSFLLRGVGIRLPAAGEDELLSCLDCQEFPLELIRKLTADEDEEDEEDRELRVWLAEEPEGDEEEENELEKVEDEPAPSGLCLGA